MGIGLGKAHRMIGMLKRTFESGDSRLWKDLYVSQVSPHLEYAVQVWKETSIN